MRIALFSLITLFAALLPAQEYLLETELGIGGTAQTPGLVAAPFAPLTVHIQRTDTRPFKGRVVVEMSGRAARGPFGDDRPAFELSQELNLEEGTQNAVVRFEIPVYRNSLEGQVALERNFGDGFEPVSARAFTGAVHGDNRALVGFISQARLASAQPYLFQDLIEIQNQQLPENWKLLACFDAIVLNDDRLSRKQAEALVDYVIAGGTLVVSPNTAAAFNPELPIARLLGLTSAPNQAGVRLSDFKILREKPKISGLSRGTAGGPTNPEGDTGTVKPPEGEDPPLDPRDDSELSLWQGAGRARPLEDLRSLLSYARAGAGSVIFVHADFSQFPLVTASERKPTTAGVNLVSLALKHAAQGVRRSAMGRLAAGDNRDTLDIAGKRIPGRDMQVLLIFLYVSAAGVGMFLLARRLRRPEIYPAALLALAVLSVLLVFSLGEVYKRAGDRVRMVRLVVSDGVTQRNAVFTVGCAYVVDQTRLEFAQDRTPWLVPTGLKDGNIRGLPADYAQYTASSSAVETVTQVQDLVRWQNLFFASAEPAAVSDLQLRVTGDGGAQTIENRSPHTVSGCLILIGGPPIAATGMPRCKWHYLSTLGAAGSADARVPLSSTTLAPNDGSAIASLLLDRNDEFEAASLCALLGISPNRRVMMPHGLSDMEQSLNTCELLPDEGEFLVIGILPENAVSKGSMGLRDTDPDRVGQAVIWATRGLMESR